jgi:hypothetical protein
MNSDEAFQLLCLETAIEKSTCFATNETCVCTNIPLQTQVTLCVTESCTIIEGLSKLFRFRNDGDEI